MTRVLFVDDEALVLSSLRRSLIDMSREWEMSFVDSGEAALRQLSETPADVVVSDMRMPGMDGATLLTEVRDQFPNTARIILSGYAAQASVMRSIGVAHQFLEKPCDNALLRQTVSRLCDLQTRLSNNKVRSLIESIPSLPSPSETVIALNRCLAGEDISVDEVLDIVGHDMAMSARVLQLVNSAFFGLASSIDDLHQAVAYLGLSTLRELAVAAEAFQSFKPNESVLGEALEDLRNHSVEVASLASWLAEDPAMAAQAYTGGLLHDVGKLILATYRPAQYTATCRRLRDHAELDRIRVESDEFGATHSDIGASFLTLWGLPVALTEIVATHHEYGSVENAPVMSAAVAVQLADTLHRGRFEDLPSRQALERLGIAEKISADRPV